MNTQKSIRIPFFVLVCLFLAAGLTSSCEKESFLPAGEEVSVDIFAQDYQEYPDAELTAGAFGEEMPVEVSEQDYQKFQDAKRTAGALGEEVPVVFPIQDHQKYQDANYTADAFSAKVVWADCTVEGRSYEVIMDNPQDYSFRWTVNGEHAGHERFSPSCLCEGTATVYITRLKDGYTQHSELQLPACGGVIE